MVSKTRSKVVDTPSGGSYFIPPHPLWACCAGPRAYACGATRLSGPPGCGKSRLVFCWAAEALQWGDIFRSAIQEVCPVTPTEDGRNTICWGELQTVHVGLTEDVGSAYLLYVPRSLRERVVLWRLVYWPDLVLLVKEAALECRRGKAAMSICDSITALIPALYAEQAAYDIIESPIPMYEQGEGVLQRSVRWENPPATPSSPTARGAISASLLAPTLGQYLRETFLVLTAQDRQAIGSGFTYPHPAGGGQAINHLVNPDVRLARTDTPHLGQLSVKKSATNIDGAQALRVILAPGGLTASVGCLLLGWSFRAGVLRTNAGEFPVDSLLDLPTELVYAVAVAAYRYAANWRGGTGSDAD